MILKTYIFIDVYNLSMLTRDAKNDKMGNCNLYNVVEDTKLKMFKLLRLKGFSTI